MKPNVVCVFADQWRQQATGYAGNPNVQTPNLDALAEDSVNFTHAVSGCPVCSPHRASLLTGQRAVRTGGPGKLEAALQAKLDETADEFLPGMAYVEQWGYLPDGNQMVYETR